MQSLLTNWYATAQGQALLGAEAAAFERILTNISPDDCLQIGGVPSSLFLPEKKLNSSMNCSISSDGLIDMPPCNPSGHSIVLQASSIDLIILPHTLDRLENYQILLAQTYALLRPGGDLLILQFNPFSLLSIASQLGFRPADFPACYFHALGPMCRYMKQKGMVKKGSVNTPHVWLQPFAKSVRKKSTAHHTGFMLRIRAYCVDGFGVSGLTHWHKNASQVKLIGQYGREPLFGAAHGMASAHHVKSS